MDGYTSPRGLYGFATLDKNHEKHMHVAKSRPEECCLLLSLQRMCCSEETWHGLNNIASAAENKSWRPICPLVLLLIACLSAIWFNDARIMYIDKHRLLPLSMTGASHCSNQPLGHSISEVSKQDLSQLKRCTVGTPL